MRGTTQSKCQGDDLGVNRVNTWSAKDSLRAAGAKRARTGVQRTHTFRGTRTDTLQSEGRFEARKERKMIGQVMGITVAGAF